MAQGGWVAGARRVLSPNCDGRPAGSEVSLLVLHSISLPRGRFGGDAIERLFTNRLDSAAHASFAGLAGVRVSAHFLIRRDGELVQFVPLEARAWHAGASRWRGLEVAQYRRLAGLVRELGARLPLRAFAAHSDVAPGRKSDPGTRFDWARLLGALGRPG